MTDEELYNLLDDLSRYQEEIMCGETINGDPYFEQLRDQMREEGYEDDEHYPEDELEDARFYYDEYRAYVEDEDDEEETEGGICG